MTLRQSMMPLLMLLAASEVSKGFALYMNSSNLDNQVGGVFALGRLWPDGRFGSILLKNSVLGRLEISHEILVRTKRTLKLPCALLRHPRTNFQPLTTSPS